MSILDRMTDEKLEKIRARLERILFWSYPRVRPEMDQASIEEHIRCHAKKALAEFPDE